MANGDDWDRFDWDRFDWDRLMQAANAAPSILNTKPWSFHPVAGDRIALCADLTRWLKATDPRQRELFISCGAALFNLCAAIRVTGHDAVVWLIPDEETHPDLLAVVEKVVRRTHPATVSEQHLYEAIPWRHTVRQPFSHSIGMNMVAELVRAARMEGVDAWLLHQRQTRRLLRMARRANPVLKRDEEYVNEVRQWTGDGERVSQQYGVPKDRLAPKPKHQRRRPMRDVGLAWSPGRQGTKFEKRPKLMVLATETDSRLDWMRTGQALERLLLTATYFGVEASFLTQPFELNDRNKKDEHQRWLWPKSPQMVIRLGCTSDPGHVTRGISGGPTPVPIDTGPQPRR